MESYSLEAIFSTAMEFHASVFKGFSNHNLNHSGGLEEGSAHSPLVVERNL